MILARLNQKVGSKCFEHNFVIEPHQYLVYKSAQKVVKTQPLAPVHSFSLKIPSSKSRKERTWNSHHKAHIWTNIEKLNHNALIKRIEGKVILILDRRSDSRHSDNRFCLFYEHGIEWAPLTERTGTEKTEIWRRRRRRRMWKRHFQGGGAQGNEGRRDCRTKGKVNAFS